MQLQEAKSPVANQSEMTDLSAILSDLRCPISQDLFFYPVTLDDGHTYEREEIEQWLIKNKTSPKTSLPVKGKLKPNHTIKSILQGLLQRHPQHWKDVYLSAELRRQVLEKIEAENANELLALINKDPRLLIEKIKENQTILELVCAKKTKSLLAQTIKKLLPRDQQNVINHFQPRSADLFVALARSHEIADIKIMAEALDWQPGFYFAQAIAAIKDGDQAILNVCLDLGVRADDLLHIAIRENAEAIVQLLLQRGANPFSVNAEQQTAIETATKLPSNTMLSLLAKHVEPNKLFSVLSEKLSVEGVIEVGKLLNWNTEFYQQQAWRAVHEKALPALRVCCATGIDLQFKSKNKKYKGNTLLHLSIKNGFNDGAIILIDAGASIGIENRQHETAFDCATTAKAADVLQAMHRKYPDQIPRKDETPSAIPPAAAKAEPPASSSVFRRGFFLQSNSNGANAYKPGVLKLPEQGEVLVRLNGGKIITINQQQEIELRDSLTSAAIHNYGNLVKELDERQEFAEKMLDTMRKNESAHYRKVAAQLLNQSKAIAESQVQKFLEGLCDKDIEVAREVANGLPLLLSSRNEILAYLKAPPLFNKIPSQEIAIYAMDQMKVPDIKNIALSAFREKNNLAVQLEAVKVLVSLHPKTEGLQNILLLSLFEMKDSRIRELLIDSIEGERPLYMTRALDTLETILLSDQNLSVLGKTLKAILKLKSAPEFSAYLTKVNNNKDLKDKIIQILISFFILNAGDTNEYQNAVEYLLLLEIEESTFKKVLGLALNQTLQPTVRGKAIYAISRLTKDPIFAVDNLRVILQGNPPWSIRVIAMREVRNLLPKLPDHNRRALEISLTEMSKNIVIKLTSPPSQNITDAEYQEMINFVGEIGMVTPEIEQGLLRLLKYDMTKSQPVIIMVLDKLKIKSAELGVTLRAIAFDEQNKNGREIAMRLFLQLTGHANISIEKLFRHMLIEKSRDVSSEILSFICTLAIDKDQYANIIDDYFEQEFHVQCNAMEAVRKLKLNSAKIIKRLQNALLSRSNFVRYQAALTLCAFGFHSETIFENLLSMAILGTKEMRFSAMQALTSANDSALTHKLIQMLMANKLVPDPEIFALVISSANKLFPGLSKLKADFPNDYANIEQALFARSKIALATPLPSIPKMGRG